MSQVLALTHDPSWTSSRVTDVLRARGHSVEVRCPAAGDPVPASASEFDAIVVGGHSLTVYDAEHHPDIAAELALAADAVRTGVPYLGICYGAQVLGHAHGAAVGARPDGAAEYGFFPLLPTPTGADLFGDVGHVFQAHYHSCLTLPVDGELLASSELFEIQAFRIGERAYGLQFHPDAYVEVVAGWWDGATYLHGRDGVHPLARQVADAERYEAAVQRWTERFVAHWLG